MKLTEVIAIWDILHVKHVGDLGYCDLQDAIEEVVGIENDISNWSRTTVKASGQDDDA